MKKLIVCELEYDPKQVHGDDPDAVKWWNEKVLPSLSGPAMWKGDRYGTLTIAAFSPTTPEPDERGPEVGDIVMYEFDDGSRGPREWSKWQEINDPFDGEIAPSRIVVLMRRAEIEARMGGVK